MRHGALCGLASAIASVVVLGEGDAAAQGGGEPNLADLAAPPADDAVLDRALLGARGPAQLDLVLHGSAGFAMILPEVTLAGRLGLGAGFNAELGYRNLAVFGQEGRARFAWGARATRAWDIGVALRTSVASLELGDGAVIGIPLSSVPLGNDWEVGDDLVVTLDGPGTVSITGQLGPTFTMGGLRTTGNETNAFELDPAFRSVNAVGIVEWGLWKHTNVFLRFDAMFLLGVETDHDCEAAHQDNCGQLVPIGFLPTASAGLAWAP